MSLRARRPRPPGCEPDTRRADHRCQAANWTTPAPAEWGKSGRGRGDFRAGSPRCAGHPLPPRSRSPSRPAARHPHPLHSPSPRLLVPLSTSPPVRPVARGATPATWTCPTWGRWPRRLCHRLLGKLGPCESASLRQVPPPARPTSGPGRQSTPLMSATLWSREGGGGTVSLRASVARGSAGHPRGPQEGRGRPRRRRSSFRPGARDRPDTSGRSGCGW
jgi:hypothetical protein